MKRTEHALCVIKPYAQLAKGGANGPCLNFVYFSMLFHGKKPPPLNTSLHPPVAFNLSPILLLLLLLLLLGSSASESATGK